MDLIAHWIEFAIGTVIPQTLTLTGFGIYSSLTSKVCRDVATRVPHAFEQAHSAKHPKVVDAVNDFRTWVWATATYSIQQCAIVWPRDCPRNATDVSPALQRCNASCICKCTSSL